MKPVYQTKFTSLDGSTHGNCLAACVASILEVPINDIPQWEEMGEEWIDSFFEFLESQGLECEGSFRMSGSPASWEYLHSHGSRGVDGYYIVGGKSPRTYVQRGHAVIYHNGEMIHDPHPGGDGLLQIEDVYLIERATSALPESTEGAT